MDEKVVNSHLAGWAHLKTNQYCSLSLYPEGYHWWTNPQGEYHRVDENGIQDGPAIISDLGTQEWYINGKHHWVDENGHQDGPAVIDPDGSQFWCLNEKYHRLDGPACIWADGYQRWYLDDVQMTQEQWAQDPRVIEFHSQTPEGAEQWLKSL